MCVFRVVVYVGAACYSVYVRRRSETCLVRTSKGTRNQYLLSEVLTYYQGWFMYMKYTQGQNEEYLLSRSMYFNRLCPI